MSAIKNFFVTFCIAVLLFGLIGWYAMTYALDNIMPGIVNNADSSGPGSAPGSQTGKSETTGEDEIPESEAQPDHYDVNTFTALLIGTDYQPEIFKDYDLTERNKNVEGFPLPERKITADTLVIVHIDNDAKTFMSSAVPSNMNILVDGVSTRLGALYESKGVDFLCDKITAVTGLKIDFYMSVTMRNFAGIIDDIGGITFSVPVNMTYEDESQDLKINLTEGSHKLNGDKALQLLRYRSYSDGNISRMTIALNFIKALLEKLTSPENLTKAASLYDTLIKNITTNFNETLLPEYIDTIFSYPKLTPVELLYPGEPRASNEYGEYFEPDIARAVGMYKPYK